MIKTICFATRGLVFDGNSLNTKSLGGSESAVIYMANELSLLGNVVYVFCECETPGVYNNIIYQDVDDFENKVHFKFDVLIISRFLQLHPKTQISNMTIFWMHDIYDALFTDYVHLCDVTFLMSEYQKTLWCSIETKFSDIIYLTKNGYDSYLCETIDIQPFIKKKNHYIYASRPERGLKKLLLDIWPKVLIMNPEAVLHICGYDNNMSNKPDWYADYEQEIEYLLKNTVNVKIEGSLTKKDYYILLSNCAYMLYPTDFPEISCINAIEAQAMQCLVVSTNAYALAETIKTDTLVGTNVEDFLSVVYKYQDEYLYKKEVTRAAATLISEKYAWRNIAKEWDLYIDSFFINRFNNNKSKIIKQLIYTSDLLTAQYIDSSVRTLVNKVISRHTQEGNYVRICESNTERIISMVNILCEFIQDRPLTILDLGCNTGIISRRILSRCNNAKVIAYDLNQNALDDYAAITVDRVEFICDTVDNLASHNIKADVVVAGEILEHLECYVDVINDIDACLNNNGLALYSTPLGPWSSGSSSAEEHLVHFDVLDILTLFSEHIQNQRFIMQSVKSHISLKGDILSNLIFGYVKTLNVKVAPLSSQFIEDKIIKTRPYNTLSACLIVKNEENNLFRCLNSIKNIVDEIIIVDTGSIDNTKYISSLFTDNVFDYIWRDSFSDAKNFALSKATGDWILSIDADEELIGTNIRQYTQSPFVNMYTITQRQVDNSKEEDQQPLRLFKKGLSFKGNIHEEIVEDSGIKLYIKELYLRHFGYLDDVDFQLSKLTRNHAILLKDIQDNPNREVNFMYYIRDMFHFYSLSFNTAFVQLAEDTWKFCEAKMLNVTYKEKTLQFITLLRKKYNETHIIC